jgi:uncharacterized protein YndB with AHSA1/START domain
MTVVTTKKDVENLTLTVVAELDASRERVWELWEDPRKLERWWARRRSLRPSPATSSSQAASRATT